MKILIEKETAQWFSKIAERLNREMRKAEKAKDLELYRKLDYILWGTTKEKHVEISRITKGRE